MNKFKKKIIYGFTLLEILAVIAIIITLIGIGIPAYNSWRNRGQIARAKAVIQQIEIALEMYRSDNGVYPNNSGNLNRGTILTVLGQYLRMRREDLDISGTIVNDPWGMGYIVYVDDGNPANDPSDFTHNRCASYIYSQGPSTTDPNDNIDNFGSF